MTDLFGHTEIKALSWKEPYASLMLHGKIETRTWNTNYRGLVLICASQKPYKKAEFMVISGYAQSQRIFTTLNNLTHKEQLGKAIAIGELIHCRLMQPEDEDKCFVKYAPGKFCHIYTNVQAIEPFDWKGCQGWKNVTQEIINKIKFLK